MTVEAADLAVVAWNGLVFTGVWTLFGHAGAFYNWLATILATVFAASGIGYVTSAWTRPVNAIVATIMAVVVCSVFSGIEPPLARIMPLPVVNWLWMLSFGTWTAEATYVTFTEFARNVYDVGRGAAYYGFEVADLSRAIGALFALGVMWRVVAIASLYLTLERRQPAWVAATVRAAVGAEGRRRWRGVSRLRVRRIGIGWRHLSTALPAPCRRIYLPFRMCHAFHCASTAHCSDSHDRRRLRVANEGGCRC